MQTKFSPTYVITPKIVHALLRIEAAKERVAHLPLTPTVLSSLRETARLFTTHYSTMIEGNRLQPEEIEVVLKHEGHFPGRERDAAEVQGYYAALTRVEQWVAARTHVTEKTIQTLHALVMSNGKTKVKSTHYREGQNVIRDGRTKAIVYLPPEAKDVPNLMKELVTWIHQNNELPCPLVAAMAHYQFATIHPYYDGNGRTARLLTTMILHLGGYDLKGLYSLEEYYARHLRDYYQAISVGDSHNYYMGRAKADVTKWIEYFIEGMATSFESVLRQMGKMNLEKTPDHSTLLRELDPRQRKTLSLFQNSTLVTSSQIGELFGLKPRASAALCAAWVQSGFLEVADPSNRTRKYRLSPLYEKIATT